MEGGILAALTADWDADWETEPHLCTRACLLSLTSRLQSYKCLLFLFYNRAFLDITFQVNSLQTLPSSVSVCGLLVCFPSAVSFSWF